MAAGRDLPRMSTGCGNLGTDIQPVSGKDHEAGRLIPPVARADRRSAPASRLGLSASARPTVLHRISADAVLLLHLAFILFVLFGALLALKWRWMPWVHLPAASWGMFVEVSGRVCPLTPLENRLRAHAGEAGYEGGFIEHYLLALIYPDGLTREIQFVLAAVVLLVNALLYAWLLKRRRQRRQTR